MKKHLFLFLLYVGSLLTGLAQPNMTNGVSGLNLDDAGNSELRYFVGASKLGSAPEMWDAGFSLEPLGQSRLLRVSVQRVSFALGENVNAARKEYQQGGNLNLPLLVYRAISFDGGATWEYQTLTAAFEKESELLLGLKLALPAGTHYGWLKLTRLTVDLHTPFEIQGWAYHPVPGEAIGAGEPPPPPPLQSSVAEDGSLTFNWDTAWGDVLLEWTDSLDQPNWQPVPDASVPPVVLLPGEGQSFYRLRRP